MEHCKLSCAARRGGGAIPHVASHMEVPLNLAAYAVWGANTDVGKTLVSACLCLAAATEAQDGAGPGAVYVKPVQTGFPGDSDGRTVVLASRLAGGTCVHRVGAHAGACVSSDSDRASLLIDGGKADSDAAVVAHTLFAWRDAVGPHLAVEREGCAQARIGRAESNHSDVMV